MRRTRFVFNSFGDAEARRFAEDALRSVEIPAQLSVEAMIGICSSITGLPIRVEEAPALSHSATGGLTIRESECVVHLAPGLTPLLHQQTILHELAHIMIGLHDHHEELFDSIGGRVAYYRSHTNGTNERATEMLADHLAAIIRDSTHEPREFERVFG